MNTIPILAVIPLENRVLQVEWQTGSVTLLNMRPKLKYNRFAPLDDESTWLSVKTDGRTIFWTDPSGFLHELSFNEVWDLTSGY